MTLFGIALKPRRILLSILCIAWVYFFYLMILITLQYIPIQLDVAFLQIKQNEIQHQHYQIAFFTHVYTSIFVLLLGFFQFSTYIRKKYSSLHKLLGKIYIVLILFLAGPSGLIMGYYGNGGWIAQLSFCILAILWILFTYKAYIYARKRNWKQHKNYMYRSYALTLSAISLRLFKWIIASTLALAPMHTYRIVAWLGWVFNIVIVEGIIYFRVKYSVKNKKL